MTTNPLSVEELDVLAAQVGDDNGWLTIHTSRLVPVIAAARKGIEADAYWADFAAKAADAGFSPTPGKGVRAEATQDIGMTADEMMGLGKYDPFPSEDRGECGGCTCKRQIPYVDFSHEPHCRLYFALPSNTGEEVERVVEKLRYWDSQTYPVELDCLGDLLPKAASLLSSISEQLAKAKSNLDYYGKLYKEQHDIDKSELTEAKAENERLKGLLRSCTSPHGLTVAEQEEWLTRRDAALTGGA